MIQAKGHDQSLGLRHPLATRDGAFEDRQGLPVPSRTREFSPNAQREVGVTLGVAFCFDLRKCREGAIEPIGSQGTALPGLEVLHRELVDALSKRLLDFGGLLRVLRRGLRDAPLRRKREGDEEG